MNILPLIFVFSLKGPRKAVLGAKERWKSTQLWKYSAYMTFKPNKMSLLVLISKYARDPWRRSLTSQRGAEAYGERGAFSPSITSQRKCHVNVRPWDAQSCRQKGRCFPFTPSQKIAVEGSFILGDSIWKFFQVGYPVDTHTDMNFLLRVSVTYRPALAGLIFGRWKERSLRMKSPSLPILQGIYPDRPKESEIHFDTLAPSAKIKIKKGEKPPSQETPEKEREINKSGRCTHKSSARMSS